MSGKHLFEGYATGENSGSANPLDVGCFELAKVSANNEKY